MNFIFGYGSLIFANGINGRGMKRIYTENDLTPAHLYEYRRAWNAVYNGDTYLGLAPDRDGKVNGVIFPIDDVDIPAFFDSEGIDNPFGERYRPPMYNYTDVTRCMDLEHDEDITVFTCVTFAPNHTQAVPLRYLHTIERGLWWRGSTFRQEFYDLTYER